MDNFTYCTPTKYIFGRGAESHAGEETKALGLKSVLIVYGGGSAVKSGLLDRVKASLDASGIAHDELGGIQPNPTDPKVREGIEICRRQGIEGLLAVGGGSVIDTAKAIAAGVVYEGDFWDFWAGKAVIGNALPVGVVLTIPAAGSEGSGNSVITLLDGMHKISLRTDYWLRPKFALLNPELTFTLPPAQTAAGVCDMMAHILERYFSPTQDVEITDRMPCSFTCNCSKERVEKALISIGKKELQEMIDEDKPIEVNCHFCGKTYRVDVDELKKMEKKSR